ncbi:hypothetical protein [Cohnella fermenti]|uniref:Uncharacterized protein n=1 Tax=Cohnella fermenti TaxID=2565925 RepID=A0A4S4BFW6_9BACL|nr:hypothetical protein [Cohnella fermenti]THF73265.1 hypothetical protein E6C55_30030 [Cohnella fermenti]
MTRLLDARTSQNSSFAGSLAIPLLPVDQDQLFAVVGLNCLQPTGVVRAQFGATVSIQYEPGGIRNVTLSVYRQIMLGEVPLGASALVYTATLSELTQQDSVVRVFTVVGSDYDIQTPNVCLVKYTAYVRGDTAGLVRTGPESFDASLYCD